MNTFLIFKLHNCTIAQLHNCTIAKAHGVRSAVRLTQVLSPRLIRWVQKKPLSLGGHTFVNLKSNL